MYPKSFAVSVLLFCCISESVLATGILFNVIRNTIKETRCKLHDIGSKFISHGHISEPCVEHYHNQGNTQFGTQNGYNGNENIRGNIRGYDNQNQERNYGFGYEQQPAYNGYPYGLSNNPSPSYTSPGYPAYNIYPYVPSNTPSPGSTSPGYPGYNGYPYGSSNNPSPGYASPGYPSGSSPNTKGMPYIGNNDLEGKRFTNINNNPDRYDIKPGNINAGTLDSNNPKAVEISPESTTKAIYTESTTKQVYIESTTKSSENECMEKLVQEIFGTPNQNVGEGSNGEKAGTLKVTSEIYPSSLNIDIRSGNDENDQRTTTKKYADVPTGAGRNVAKVKPNCPAGKIATKSGECMDEF